MRGWTLYSSNAHFELFALFLVIIDKGRVFIRSSRFERFSHIYYYLYTNYTINTSWSKFTNILFKEQSCQHIIKFHRAQNSNVTHSFDNT
jgi:hypothetical protein